MTNTNTVRVTKAQKYAAIITIIEAADAYDNAPVVIPGVTLKDGTQKEDAVLDRETLIEFCNAEVAALSKKSKSKDKLTPEQEKNLEYCDIILDYLREQTEGKTCSDMIAEIPTFAADTRTFNGQKVTHLCKRLFDEGKITRNKVKGVSYFHYVAE